ncbi:hypothetical protein PF005_g29989 [Phytophthora fragariae]|nr:hypothetical protein PF005_g29989 [Phytophthora fragariae]KAE9268340.1 hypothetical protein PF001_g29687 [Phytophthora fragariae]
MDAVAESLVSEYISMNHVTRLTFRMEQICLIYAANNGMRVPRGESEPDTLSYLINNNIARLHESEPFTLERGHSPFPLLDCAEPTTWQFLTDIPGPQCGALLHLCLMGGKTAGPSKSSNTPISFRQAFETANFEGGALKFDFANADHENSIAAGIPRETLVAGAIVSASRQNGFAGIAFPEFLSLLMYELGIQTSPDIRVKLDADVLELVASLKVPFLAPLDAEWPDFLTRTTLNLGLLFGKRDADRSSFCFLQDQITIECNICRNQLTRDFILGIFKRIPITSRVHLVILNSLQSLYFFHEDALRDGREYLFQNTLFNRVRNVRRASCPESCVKLQVCRYIQDKARVVKKTTCQRIVIFVELSEIEAPRA